MSGKRSKTSQNIQWNTKCFEAETIAALEAVARLNGMYPGEYANEVLRPVLRDELKKAIENPKSDMTPIQKRRVERHYPRLLQDLDEAPNFRTDSKVAKLKL